MSVGRFLYIKNTSKSQFLRICVTRGLRDVIIFVLFVSELVGRRLSLAGRSAVVSSEGAPSFRPENTPGD